MAGSPRLLAPRGEHRIGSVFQKHTRSLLVPAHHPEDCEKQNRLNHVATRLMSMRVALMIAHSRVCAQVKRERLAPSASRLLEQVRSTMRMLLPRLLARIARLFFLTRLTVRCSGALYAMGYSSSLPGWMRKRVITLLNAVCSLSTCLAL